MNNRNGAPASASVAVLAWSGALLFAVSLAYGVYCYVIVFGRSAEPGSAIPSAVVNAGLFSIFALHHSLFARTRLKAWVRRTAPPLLERSIYTWVASLLFLAVCAFWRPVPGELYRLEGLLWWVGAGAQIAGLVLTFLGARALDVLDLAGVRTALPSRGATGRPAPLVTSGPFALVRHPLYFGWALLVFGAPHMTATRFIFALVSTAYLALAIPWEERGLLETFGPAYDEYRRRVRWRMMPGVY
jgi:protein-S-isoprenylcysteine O-methyltransferase Ste14